MAEDIEIKVRSKEKLERDLNKLAEKIEKYIKAGKIKEIHLVKKEEPGFKLQYSIIVEINKKVRDIKFIKRGEKHYYECIEIIEKFEERLENLAKKIWNETWDDYWIINIKNLTF